MRSYIVKEERLIYIQYNEIQLAGIKCVKTTSSRAGRLQTMPRFMPRLLTDVDLRLRGYRVYQHSRVSTCMYQKVYSSSINGHCC